MTLFYPAVKHSADAQVSCIHEACHGFRTNDFNPSKSPPIILGCVNKLKKMRAKNMDFLFFAGMLLWCNWEENLTCCIRFCRVQTIIPGQILICASRSYFTEALKKYTCCGPKCGVAGSERLLSGLKGLLAKKKKKKKIAIKLLKWTTDGFFESLICFPLLGKAEHVCL